MWGKEEGDDDARVCAPSTWKGAGAVSRDGEWGERLAGKAVWGSRSGLGMLLVPTGHVEGPAGSWSPAFSGEMPPEEVNLAADDRRGDFEPMGMGEGRRREKTLEGCPGFGNGAEKQGCWQRV